MNGTPIRRVPAANPVVAPAGPKPSLSVPGKKYAIKMLINKRDVYLGYRPADRNLATFAVKESDGRWRYPVQEFPTYEAAAKVASALMLLAAEPAGIRVTDFPS
jgi:hypothetical protein